MNNVIYLEELVPVLCDHGYVSYIAANYSATNKDISIQFISIQFISVTVS